MILDEILEHNRRFVSQGRGERLAVEPRRRACIVTCMDSRLVDFLPRALGVGRGDADWVASAGHAITPYDNAVVRSVAISVYLHRVSDVLVVGHTTCGAASDVLPFSTAMEEAGVPRSAVGGVDLREFFGLVPSPETNVRQVVDALRRSPVIPPEVLIHGLLVDTVSGGLSVVVRGEPGPPRHDLRPAPLAAADLDRARTPEVRVGVEPAPPVAVLLSPPTPVAERSRPLDSRVSAAIFGAVPPGPKPEAAEAVEVVLGPATPGRAPAPPPPPAPPPGKAPPSITIDVQPAAPTSGKPQRPVPRPRPEPPGAEVDIRLGQKRPRR
jgi:carbonic anhydrase